MDKVEDINPVELFQWNDELIVCYAEIHRFSSGRVSLKSFKEMIGTKWEKVLQKKAKELLNEWEQKGNNDGDAVEFADWLVKEMKVEPVGAMWEVHGVEHVFEDGKTAMCPVRSTGFLYKLFKLSKL